MSSIVGWSVGSAIARPSLTTRFEGMRRPTTVEVMLLSAIGLWALNLTFSRYILTHGFQPLAYSTVRYGLASLVFVGDRPRRRALVPDGAGRLPRRGRRGGVVWINQIGFVYSLKTTSASVIALIMGATPIFAALIGLAFGTERLPARFWLGAGLSFTGVAFVALGTREQLSGDMRGILYGLGTAATWAVYSILVTPLMRRYSASRISALVLPISWVGIAHRRLAADELAELGPRLGGVGAPRRRHARSPRDHEHPLVPLARPDRPIARDAGHEPAAVPRRRRRRRPPRRAHGPRPDLRRHPHRGRGSSPPGGARPSLRASRSRSPAAVRSRDDAAAPHRARLRRRRHRADGDQAPDRARELEPRPDLGGAPLGHGPRRGVAHVLRDRRRRPSGRHLAPVRPREGRAPRRARRSRRPPARQPRRRRPRGRAARRLDRDRDVDGVVGVRSGRARDRDRRLAYGRLDPCRPRLREPGARLECAPLRQ